MGRPRGGCFTIVVRLTSGGPALTASASPLAVDSASNTQPESPAPIYNLRGVLNNSWHRILVNAPALYERRSKERAAAAAAEAAVAKANGLKAHL